jgi:hypothetical protein
VRTRFGSDNLVIRWYMRVGPGLRTVAKGADTLVWLASSQQDQLVDGGYYFDRKLVRPARHAADADLAARLWDASLAAVGLNRSAG